MREVDKTIGYIKISVFIVFLCIPIWPLNSFFKLEVRVDRHMLFLLGSLVYCTSIGMFIPSGNNTAS